MAKILYGVSGEGSGHSSRARLIASHLIKQGHQVKIASYDRGYRNLKDDFDTLEIAGLTIVSEDNEVSKLKTITTNLAKIPEGGKTLKELRDLIKNFQPDCVITDFEPCTAYLAAHYNLPLVSLDNQHRMRYMALDYPNELKTEAKLTATIIRAMVPRPWVSLITTFHFGQLTNDKAFTFPPILRESILSLKSEEQEHILVYVTSAFESLIELLPQFPREKFVVYGYDRDDTDGNITYRKHSPTQFPADLASAKAVIATAGFTLISEALHLGKPYLAFPMQGQFEQRLNALMLEAQTLGAQALIPDSKTIAAFLYSIPDVRQALESYPREGNTAILTKLDQLLEDNLKLLKSYKP